MTAVKVEEMPSQMLATEVFRRGWAKHYGIARNYRGKLKNAVAHLRVKRHAQYKNPNRKRHGMPGMGVEPLESHVFQKEKKKKKKKNSNGMGQQQQQQQRK